MGTISVSLPSDGTTADVADINTPINTIVNTINGGLDNANIASGAAIATSKLADDGGITYAKVASGFPVQISAANFSAVATGTTTIPLDDTLPQNTEGDQYMTLSFTPKSATNTLVIRATAWLSSSAASTTIVAALFKDSTSDALAVGVEYEGLGTAMHNIPILHTMTAGTTSAITFKVRAGASAAGTTTFNGAAGARYFAGTTKSYIEVLEYKA